MTTTKHRVSEEQRRKVLDPRRRHSLREVASITGLPLGTVKTIASRSGAFRDNTQQRALFSLPPIRESAETLPCNWAPASTWPRRPSPTLPVTTA